MHRAAWDVDEITWLRMDRLPARLERGTALQHVEGLVLEMVNVRRRASSRRNHALDDETAYVRFRARDQKAYLVAWSAIQLAGSGWHILDLVLILHGFDFFFASVLFLFDDLACAKSNRAFVLSPSGILKMRLRAQK